MAHEILPQHRPHEQLRTEPPKQRHHSDKYVSAFISSDNFADMSFSNPLLQESADHFRVGIDELTVNLAHLSMLEYDAAGTNVLFRIRRLGYFGAGAQHSDVNNLTFVAAPANTGTTHSSSHYGLPTAELARALEFKIERQYNTLAEIMERATEICRALGTYIRMNGLVNPNPANYNNAEEATYQKWNRAIGSGDASDAGVLDYLDVFLTSGGLLKFKGNKIFWSNFVIEVPDERSRYMLLGNTTKQFISLHPSTGAIHEAYAENDAENQEVQPFDNWAAIDTTTWIDDPELKETEFHRTFTGAINIANSLDRRVALEVGCSLPIKNSPMIDHGKEAPDFVLGRFPLFRDGDVDGVTNQNDGTLRLNARVGANARQLQGPRDRVCYHHLGPQQKIQTLRLRLWARVRTYNNADKKWGMKTIQFPVEGSDYWHIKLHFTPK